MTKRIAWIMWSIIAIVLLGGLYLYSNTTDSVKTQITCRMESAIQSAPPTNILVKMQFYDGNKIVADLPSGYAYGSPATIVRTDKKATYMLMVGSGGQGLIVNMGSGSYTTKGFMVDLSGAGTGTAIDCEPAVYEIK